MFTALERSNFKELQPQDLAQHSNIVILQGVGLYVG